MRRKVTKRDKGCDKRLHRLMEYFNTTANWGQPCKDFCSLHSSLRQPFIVRKISKNCNVMNDKHDHRSAISIATLSVDVSVHNNNMICSCIAHVHGHHYSQELP